MGKSPKPITFLLTERSMLEWPRFVELQGQGHTLTLLDDVLPGVGIVMGMRAHYLPPCTVPEAIRQPDVRSAAEKEVWTRNAAIYEACNGMVDVALKHARALQYPKLNKE